MREKKRSGKSRAAFARATEVLGGDGGSADREIDGAGVRASGDGGELR